MNKAASACSNQGFSLGSSRACTSLLSGGTQFGSALFSVQARSMKALRPALSVTGRIVSPPLMRVSALALAGVAGGDAAGKLGYLRPAPGGLGRVAEVEHRRALRRPLGAVIVGAEQLVPGEGGDAVITVLVVEMVLHVALLHLHQPLVLWLVGEMLDAVAEFVEAGREQPGGEGRAGDAESTPRITDRDRGDGDGRHRRMERAEQDLE